MEGCSTKDSFAAVTLDKYVCFTVFDVYFCYHSYETGGRMRKFVFLNIRKSFGVLGSLEPHHKTALLLVTSATTQK